MKIVDFISGPLYKFCPEQFNIKNGCNTIRLGTLYEYRTHEDPLLRDDGEGLYEYKISFSDPTTVSQEWLTSLEVENGSKTQVNGLKYANNKVTIDSINLNVSCPNCWIFCVSRSAASAGNISEAHQSKWEIPIDNIDTFANHLTNLLMNSLSYSDLPDQLTKNHTMKEIQDGLGIAVEHCDVTYANREILIQNEEDLPIEHMENLRRSIPFTKPITFQPENEHRFVFSLTFRGEKISINNNSKILLLRPIDKILK